ncbi:MAG TPA: ATP-binding protein [Desulfobacteria bacterium]|nr:ATP-binding protein [Desulfobacteria bacterium]
MNGHRYSNKTILLINLILLEAVLVVIVNLFILITVNGDLSSALKYILKVGAFTAMVVAFIALFVVREIVRLSEKEQEAKVNEVLLSKSKETVDLLRMHRHDFVNHLQVILGMLQLRRFDNAIEYIKDVGGEAGNSNCMNDIENPLLASLIAEKRLRAERFGVQLFIEFRSQFTRIPVSLSKLSSLIGNLMDNAITAAQECLDEKGIVELELYEEQHSFNISVHNNGASIPVELQEKVFEKGISTKSEDGHGYGLFIIKSIVEQYSGVITCTSSMTEGTTFEVVIPKTNPQTVV